MSPTRNSNRLPVRLVAIAAAMLIVVGAIVVARGAGSAPAMASCSVTRSELGLYGPDHLIGSTMNDDEARARMQAEGITGWLEIHADGNWQQGWDHATDQLGNGIHQQLAWLDVDGRIEGLFDEDDAFAFADMTVSRSYQGKIEHEDAGLFIPVQEPLDTTMQAGCTVTAVHVAEDGADDRLDVLDAVNS